MTTRDEKEVHADRVEHFWQELDGLLEAGLIDTSAVAARLAGIAARRGIEHGAKAAGYAVMEHIARTMGRRD
jgi:hypothetical protein